MIFVKVLSTSVAEAFALYDYPDTSETERFVRTFDKFFDCLNVRSTDEYVKQRKPNLRPYTDITDERLTVSVSCFLNYISYFCIYTVAGAQPFRIPEGMGGECK